MEVKNITKQEFYDLRKDIFNQLISLVGKDSLTISNYKKQKGRVNRETMLKVIALLKSYGFTQYGDVINRYDANFEMKYALLYQSHKQRQNYEFIVKIGKFIKNDYYNFSFSTVSAYPPNKHGKIEKEFNLHLHDLIFDV